MLLVFFTFLYFYISALQAPMNAMVKRGSRHLVKAVATNVLAALNDTAT